MDGNYGQNQNWQEQGRNQPNQSWQEQNRNQPNQNWQNPNRNNYYNGYYNGQPNNGQPNNSYPNMNGYPNPNMNGYPYPNMPNQGYAGNNGNNGYNNYMPNGYNGPIAVANAMPPKTGGLAVGSLVCGIIDLICFWTVITVIAAIVGIVLGAVNNAQDNPNKGMAAAGIILNALSIILSTAFVVIIAML